MISRIANLFKITKYEARGSVGLFFLVLMLFLIKLIWIGNSDETKIVWLNNSENEPLQVSKDYNSKRKQQQVKSENFNSKQQIRLKFPDTLLNLNALTEMNLLSIGFSNKKVNILIKYRDALGYFRTEKEVLSTYGWDKNELDTLLRHCEIKLPLIVLNNLTFNEWTEVHGVGEVLGDRIVEFRHALGGFYSKRQLYEVYGLDSLTVDNLLNDYQITVGEFDKIPINIASMNELSAHPYISSYLAKEIVYQRSLGHINSKDDLKLIFGNSWNKIKAYVDI